ncbi:MAG: 16S rRNA (cytosine967-C5)-methyltransferase [Pseudomonadales bacterium]|jgi:16S rRNA (cytosine967-C5)-methyltransferase
MANKRQAVTNPRAVAAQVLAELISRGKSLAVLLPPAVERIDEKDRGLLQELCYGVARLSPQLSGVIDQLLKKPLREKDTDIYALLLIGAYQLSHMRVPDHAAMSETVEAAKQLNKIWAKGFINGVLRQYSRRREILENNLSNAATNAHPQWLFDEIELHWPDHSTQITAANNSPGPMTVRVNTRHQSRDEYLKHLSASGITASACLYADTGINLDEAIDVNLLPGFIDGHCSVQDESAQLSANLVLQNKPKKILDACCAPGGKTGHILEASTIDITLDAIDIEATRLVRVQENLDRLEVSANLITANAVDIDSWWDGDFFDAILLDAPCSATGVIRRNPDIKMLRKQEDIVKLAALQQSLLNALWQCVKPGGILIYATCSILPTENATNIESFIAANTDAKETIITGNWGIAQAVGRQILPSCDGPDGFYYACIQKHA